MVRAVVRSDVAILTATTADRSFCGEHGSQPELDGSAMNLNREQPVHLSLYGRLAGREPRRNLRTFGSRGNGCIVKASPSSEWHARRGHKSKLADNESHQPRKFFLHETIRMEADAEHVYPEPGETRHYIAEDRHDHESALANKSAPACMQNDGAPQDD